MWRRRRSKPSTRFSRGRPAIPRKSGARRHRRQRKREGPEGSLADARPDGKRGTGLRSTEERTEPRCRLFFGDFLFFLLLLFLLLFLLFGDGRGRGGGGGHRDGSLQGLVDVHAFQRGREGLHAGLIDLHTGGRQDFLQIVLVHRLAGRVQDQRAIDVFHLCSPPCSIHHPICERSSSSAAPGARAARASIWAWALANRSLTVSFVGNSDSTARLMASV